MKQLYFYRHEDQDLVYKAVLKEMRLMYNRWRKADSDWRKIETWEHYAHRRSLYYLVKQNVDLIRGPEDDLVRTIFLDPTWTREKYLASFKEER